MAFGVGAGGGGFSSGGGRPMPTIDPSNFAPDLIPLPMPPSGMLPPGSAGGGMGSGRQTQYGIMYQPGLSRDILDQLADADKYRSLPIVNEINMPSGLNPKPIKIGNFEVGAPSGFSSGSNPVYSVVSPPLIRAPSMGGMGSGGGPRYEQDPSYPMYLGGGGIFGQDLPFQGPPSPPAAGLLPPGTGTGMFGTPGSGAGTPAPQPAPTSTQPMAGTGDGSFPSVQLPEPTMPGFLSRRANPMHDAIMRSFVSQMLRRRREELKPYLETS